MQSCQGTHCSGGHGAGVRCQLCGTCWREWPTFKQFVFNTGQLRMTWWSTWTACDSKGWSAKVRHILLPVAPTSSQTMTDRVAFTAVLLCVGFFLFQWVLPSICQTALKNQYTLFSHPKWSGSYYGVIWRIITPPRQTQLCMSLLTSVSTTVGLGALGQSRTRNLCWSITFISFCFIESHKLKNTTKEGKKTGPSSCQEGENKFKG